MGKMLTMHNHSLYLASQSSSRHDLLRLADIPFQVVLHASNEKNDASIDDFGDYVMVIAQDKMAKVVIPESARAHKEIFVMTADTLVKTSKTNKILGKPANQQEAQVMLELSCKEPVEVVTAVCIEKRMWQENEWDVLKTKTILSRSHIEFCVPRDQRADYLAKEPAAMVASGAAVIEGYGLVFLKSIQGSFTGVQGLPIFEVQQALKDLGF